MIKVTHFLYVLQRRVANLLVSVEHFKCSKSKREELVKPKFDAAKLDEATHDIVGYVQHRHYGQPLRIL